MFQSSLCDYRDAYILVKGNISVANTAVAETGSNKVKKEAIFRNFAAFTDCINEVNNTEIDNAEVIDVVMY